MNNQLFYFFAFCCVLLIRCSTVNEPTVSGWVAVNSGLPENTTVTAIAAAPNSSTMYIGTYNGIYKSTNNGESWAHKSNGLTALDISCVAAGDAGQNLVYAGAWGSGVFRSQDGGESWHSVWSSDKNPHVNKIMVSPHEGAVYVATEHGLFKSTNAGDSWQHIFNYGKIKSVAVHPTDAKVLYIGARWHGNLRSRDGGESWQKINNGVYGTGQDTAAANCFVFFPTNPNQMIMSTGWVDLYRTTDGGDKWQHMAAELSDRSIVALSINRHNAKNLWALSETDGAFVTHDAGESWNKPIEGLDDVKLKSLYVTPSSDAKAYIGTLGKGIYKYVGE